MTFANEQWVAPFGLRHLPARPGRMLAGTVQSAMVFDTPLSADDLTRLYQNHSFGITEAMVRRELTETQNTAVKKGDVAIAELDAQISALQKQIGPVDDSFAWSELTRSLFLLKEFIYLR